MSTTKRVYNFAAGPACLPDEVLLEAQQELLSYKGSGRSIMEVSHRTKIFEDVIQKAEADLRQLLSVPSNYKVLFLQGGGTGQFAAVPLNLLADKSTADYMITGQWSKKAFQEAQKYCTPASVFSTEKTNFTSIAPPDEWKFSESGKAAYIYYCDNETINGVEFASMPVASDDQILVCDMSSNFLTRKVDVSKYGLIYAGAQKNSGISGVTIVIVREDLLNRGKSITPTILDYKINSDNNSLYNTPPTFSIYITSLVLQWIIRQGGIDAMERLSAQKSKLIYDVIDSSDFYRCPIDKSCRSRINIPIRIKDSKLEPIFIKEAADRGMVELAGHRSVGGLRVSLYNAMTLEGTLALTEFMKEFQQKYQ